MKNLLLLAVLVSLPLLLGGCGKEPVVEVKPEIVNLDVEGFEGVNHDELERRGFESIAYLVNSEKPFTGKTISYHENGQ